MDKKEEDLFNNGNTGKENSKNVQNKEDNFSEGTPNDNPDGP